MEPFRSRRSKISLTESEDSRVSMTTTKEFLNERIVVDILLLLSQKPSLPSTKDRRCVLDTRVVIRVQQGPLFSIQY